MLNEILLKTAVVCLLISFMLGWIMAFTHYVKIKKFSGLKPKSSYILRAHIAYIMMFFTLSIFYLLLENASISLNSYYLWFVSLSSLLLPGSFVIGAFLPRLDIKARETLNIEGTLVSLLMSLLFLSISLGYLFIACSILMQINSS